MKCTAVLILILSLAGTSASGSNANKTKTAEVTYIANEGFLIKTGDKKILIDAIFGDKDYGFCDIPTASTMKQIINNENGFKEIDLTAATHSHPDHFFAPFAATYLINHPQTMYITPRQAVNALKKQSNYETISDKIIGITPDFLSYIDTTIAGIGVRVYRLAHGPYYTDDPLTGEKINRHQKVENIGFLFNVDGVKIFHSGDSDENGIQEYEHFRLDKENIDIAFLGRGFIWKTDCPGISLVKNHINAKNIVLMHIHHDEYAEFDNIAGQLKKELAGIKIFRKEMETETYIF